MNNILKYSSKLFFLGLAASAIALATNVPATAEETPQAGQELVNHADGQWIKDATGWWFKYPDGTYPKNQWKQINSRYYYFNNQGYITTGWKQLTGFNKHKEVSWYYFDPTNGDMKTGWQAINGKWYYFDPTEGYMQMGKPFTTGVILIQKMDIELKVGGKLMAIGIILQEAWALCPHLHGMANII